MVVDGVPQLVVPPPEPNPLLDRTIVPGKGARKNYREKCRLAAQDWARTFISEEGRRSPSFSTDVAPTLYENGEIDLVKLRDYLYTLSQEERILRVDEHLLNLIGFSGAFSRLQDRRQAQYVIDQSVRPVREVYPFELP